MLCEQHTSVQHAAAHVYVTWNKDFRQSTSLCCYRQHVIGASIQLEEGPLSLMRVCRSELRRHLLSADRHGNLLWRVAQLELPVSVKQFLLYNLPLAVE